MKIITRQEARNKKLPFYFTGKSCKHGHTVKRNTISGHCVACQMENNSRFRHNNPTYHNERRSKRCQILRSIIITKLGNKCNHCGFSDVRALQIDHVNGGGNQELKKFGNLEMYLNKVLNDTSNTYQLLCSNCNWIKRSENDNERGG